MTRTLLCDLDGTLVDSAPDLRAAVNALLAARGRRQLDLAEAKSYIGDGAAKLVARSLAATGDPPDAPELARALLDFLGHYEGRLTRETRTWPGAVEALEALAADGWQLAVCTNKPELMSRRLIEELRIERLFRAVAGGDTYPVRKPHPEHLLNIMEDLNASPQDTVMLGDNANDFWAARAAGVPVVLVRFGYAREPVESLGADRILDRFAELPAMLEGLAPKAAPSH